MKTSYVEIVNDLNQLWNVCYEVNIKLGSWGDNEQVACRLLISFFSLPVLLRYN